MSEWISVEDKMPDPHQWYIIATKGNISKDSIASIGFLDTCSESGSLIWLPYNDAAAIDGDDCIDVTHWMPLPPPPTK